ncbi:DEAD/DEAH box helicase [Corynebacterium ulcerans]|uniref:DEAD/DEAH box helicase n=1 Tax=Corynebacterium ulcerans TaxID=65058 RepID=UPI0018D8EAB8|nr:DEAD/DEAH box helicase [Corynebacterium ulcerans]MBH5302769.1 DEAD/DEAH box helicase [Corynebacterium ulcerans]
MKYTPHNYQQHATTFIETHPQAAIFLGMGLGKTIITLTALEHLIYNTFQTRKALIIAPLRVARDTWPAEIKKWDHLQNLTYTIAIGDKKTREHAINTNADITIINRENIPWLVNHLENNWDYDTVIIDELSSFKSPQSQRFKALKKVRNRITRIIGLTGTPAPNSLEDIWAPFRLIDEGQRLGKYITHYRNNYFTPDKRNGQRIFTWKLKPYAESFIYKAIEDITLSMKTTDYLDLPPLTVTTETVTLDRQQRRHYDELKKDMVTDIGTNIIDAENAATLSGKLLQLASGAIYGENKSTITVHDEKLKAVESIIEAAQGNTILLAYWFKHELDRLKEKFPQGRELSTSKDVEDWCSGKIPLLFIHPASAGHGLNLQSGGHILVWLTTPWSLELVEQTNARLFRQGQTEPVSIIHIRAAGTIDENVSAALGKKDMTQSALIDAVKAQIRKEKK